MIGFHNKDNKDLLKFVFDNVAFGFVISKTPNTNIVDVNEAFCKMVGYTKEEIINTSVLKLTHPEDRGKTQTVYDTIDVNFTERIRKRYIHKDGHVVWAITRVGAVEKLEDGNTLFLAIVIDVTENRKKLENMIEYVKEVFEVN